MLGSITPLGERSRGRRWGVTVSWYFAGLVFGGAGLGMLAGALGQLLSLVSLSRQSLALLTASVVILLGVADFEPAGRRLPGLTRQVNDEWMYIYRGWAYGFGFGLQLGFGLVTIASSAALYGLVLAAAASGSITVAIAAGSVFGLVRGLTALPSARIQTGDDLADRLSRLARLEHPSLYAAAATQLCIGLIALAVLLTA